MTTFRILTALAIASTFAACKTAVEAPEGLSESPIGDINLYLFSNFDDPDPAVMQRGMEEMKAFLEGFEAGTDEVEGVDLSVESDPVPRFLEIAPLTEEHWGGAPHWTGHDPADQLPRALAVRSAHDGTAHAEIVGIEDQTPFESSSSAAYNRTFVTSFDDWLAGDADTLVTENEIHRDNLLLDLWYTAYKDYRWVEMEDGSMAVVARSWIDQQYINDQDPDDTMDFFSNMEVTIPSGDGVLRYNALWGAVVFEPEVSEGILTSTVRSGMQESYEKTEDWLNDIS